MGVNQKLLFDLQSYAGDPIEPGRIRETLETLRSHFEEAATLAPFGNEGKNRRLRRRAGDVYDLVNDLMAREWTKENRREHYARLTGSCGDCHSSFTYSRRRPPTSFDPAPLIKAPSAKSCGACHTEVFKEWASSLHARAWDDPIFRSSAGKPMKMECKACHSPEPLLFGDLSVDYGSRPVFREVNTSDSVNCVSCHLRSDGKVAARSGRPGAPCRPAPDARISSPKLCGACHNPTHDAYNEWKGSLAARKGITCNGCHSSKVDRTGADGKKKAGFSHRFPGGNDPAFVRKAIRTECSIQDRKLIVRVENDAAHRFPGEVPTRIFIIRIQFWDADETLVSEESLTFRRPSKREVGWKDNRFRPDEVRTFERPAPPAATTAKVDFLFQQSPFAVFDKWFSIDRWEGPVK